jgi:type IV secretory pathway VirB3-like protein
MAMFGIFTFFLGVSLFVHTIGLGDGYTYICYLVASGLFVAFLVPFVYTMVILVPNEDPKNFNAVMEAVNG